MWVLHYIIECRNWHTGRYCTAYKQHSPFSVARELPSTLTLRVSIHTCIKSCFTYMQVYVVKFWINSNFGQMTQTCESLSWLFYDFFYFWCCKILKNDEGKVRKPKQPHFFLFLTSCCVCTYSKLIVIEGLYNILQYLVFVVYHELQQWDWHMFYVSRQFTRWCWSCFSLCGCDDHAT